MRAVDLPLHSGHAPRWLFIRMVKLSSLLAELLIEEFGTAGFLKRLSDPLWFQAFSNVLGFDWHSSGTTTTVVAALREGLKNHPEIRVVGGKGKAALSVPEELEKLGQEWNLDVKNLVEVSRLTAKIDHACIQDGYELYHHALIISQRSEVAVIQQGMNVKTSYARRYHWLNPKKYFFLDEESLIGFKEQQVLTLVGKNEELRKSIVDLAKEVYKFPRRHWIGMKDLTKRDLEIFKRIYELDPANFKELLLIKGVGKKKLRALALTAALIYGHQLDWKDPVKYAFAHGGKDGVPFPVDKNAYDSTIRFLAELLKSTDAERKLKENTLKRLYRRVFR